MLVRDIVSYLENGELATAFDKFSDPEDYNMLMSNINVALLTICTNLPLLEKQVIIKRFPHIATYILDSKYAISNVESPYIYKYIMDTVEEPFVDDVISIRKGYSEFGMEVMLNDYNRPMDSWFVRNNSIQIPNTSRCGEFACVIYQAKHPVVVSDEDEILIPDYMTEALLAYISSRMFLTRTDERASQLASNYLEKFTAECDKVKENNLIPEFTVTNIRPIRGGWI